MYQHVNVIHHFLILIQDMINVDAIANWLLAVSIEVQINHSISRHTVPFNHNLLIMSPLSLFVEAIHLFCAFTVISMLLR